MPACQRPSDPCHDSSPERPSLSTPSCRAGAQERSAATTNQADTPGSQEQLLDNVDLTCKAVELMLTLLESHPLSQQSPPEVSRTPRAHEQAQPMNNDNPASSTAAETAPLGQAASSLSEKWPTPKPSQWQDIELIATRACTTLGWALSPAVVRRFPAEALHDLAARLYLLIQRLFTLGLQPILASHLQGYAETTSLATAMLSRLAVDGSVMVLGCTYAAEICYMFCKSDSSTILVCRVHLGCSSEPSTLDTYD